MITDEQRRKVAKELRKLATSGCIRYAEEFYEELREIVAFDRDGSFEGVANSPADLIDRPTCHVVEHKTYYGSYGCEEAGEPWVLSCSDECINDPDFPPNYCPECGAVITDAKH